MPGQPTPPDILHAFGANAAPEFITIPIPESTATPGRASMQLGFPPLTMEAIVAGGVPPFGQDVNGILYMLTANAAYAQSGQPYRWSASIAAAIGGYAVGTQLGSTDGNTIWVNLFSGNVSDPDAGGAGWAPWKSYGLNTIAVTGGTVTLTPAQARFQYLHLTGVLTSNLQLVLPAWQTEWLIANSTTGAFSVTAKTAAGTGVVIPPGGLPAPLGVYGDGTNIYPTVSPLVLPISAAPDPDTIALRTSAGYLLATYLNQTSILENFAISAVFAQAGSDGFLRKISLANLASQLLPNLAPAQSKTQTGYVTLPGGVIVQWGKNTIAGSAGTIPVAFPTVFPNAAFIGICCTADRTTGASGSFNSVNALTTAGMNIVVDINNGGQRSGFWIAVGH